MPIEIRELYIKAVIDTGGHNKKAGNKTTGDDDKNVADASEQNQEQLVDLCVEKVLEILKEKQER